VKDTGIGIDPGMQQKIFDRFKQADDSINKKYGGTGLGLAISKAHTELLGGKIWVESKPGVGSMFCFTLPYAPAIPETKDPAMEEPVVEMPAGKILVVEDEDFNFHFIQEILTKKGMTIVRATNGREAAEICTTDLTIDLVLMDIKMPEMNGFEALEIIKKHRPGLPVIGQTAYAFPQDKTRALESGFDDYITKPIKSEVLLDTVAKFMD
jgi:CheY-like chemotaxis protein